MGYDLREGREDGLAERVMFHLDLKLLRSFNAVATELSVTRAAQRLNLTQPTVSGQLKELEQALGFSLFHRTSRRVSLTEQGERLLPMVQSLLSRAEDVRHEVEAMQHASKTRFRLGAPMYSMDFADRIELLEAFGPAMPGYRFVIDNRLQSALVPDLLNDRLDAALLLGLAVPSNPADARERYVNAGYIANEIQYPDTLDRVVFRRRQIGLLVPEDSEFAQMDVIARDALRGWRIAMLGAEHGEQVIDPMANFLVSNGAMPISLPEGNALAVERYAQRNNICAIGIGWFPTPSGLVRRKVEGFDFHLDYSLVLGSGANSAARRFFEFARQWQAAREELGEPMQDFERVD